MRASVSRPLQRWTDGAGGADGVFIGPYDLSLSLGFPAPSPDAHPEVEKVIQRILTSSHAKGKKWYVPIP